MFLLLCTLLKAEKQEKKEEYNFLKEQNAIIPTNKPEFHLYYNEQERNFGIRENKNSVYATESAKITRMGDTYNILLGGQFMCFTKKGRALVVCKDKDQKGAKWNIEKHSKGYEIRNDKTTGFMFWNKEYCLTTDENIKMEECDKKSKKQQFKIKEFYKALGKDADKNEESEEDEKSSSSSSSDSGDAKDGKSQNTSLQNELAKIDHKKMHKTSDQDALAITNNKDGAPATRSECKGANKQESAKEDQPLNGGENEPKSQAVDGPDVNNISNEIAQNEHNKPTAFKGTDTKKETEKEGFIGDSFAPVTPETRKKFPGAEPNPDQFKNDDILGVSKDINDPKFNPIKAAALNILMGVDAYLGNQNGNGSVKMICKDEILNEKGDVSGPEARAVQE